jgi:hypothetical protein
MSSLFLPLLGGALIGLSAAVLLLFHGRIAGITASSRVCWLGAMLAGVFLLDGSKRQRQPTEDVSGYVSK